MKVTIDSLGRILIPKKVRKCLGLSPNTTLDLELENGRMVLEPEHRQVEIVETDGGLKVIRGIPPITHEELEGIKREQYDERFESSGSA